MTDGPVPTELMDELMRLYNAHPPRDFSFCLAYLLGKVWQDYPETIPGMLATIAAGMRDPSGDA